MYFPWITLFLSSFVIKVNSFETYGKISNELSLNEKIFIGGLIPLTGTGEEYGAGILPAVELALTHINENKNILPGYILTLQWNDTKCDMAIAAKLFFDMMHQKPPKLMLFGSSCTQVTEAIAESSPFWDLWQVSYADTNPILSDKSKYSNFYRTVPCDSDYNLARVRLIQHFNWTRVGTIFQDASEASSRFSQAHNSLSNLLDSAGIERETESFATDPHQALQNLKQKDIRIIVGNFDEAHALKVFCAAYSLQMYGERYAWIILDSYTSHWWEKSIDDMGCTHVELKEALQGYISNSPIQFSTTTKVTSSNMSISDYLLMYDKSRGKAFSEYHGYAYDAIWVIAYLIDSILKQTGKIDITRYRNESLQSLLEETHFFGVTGQVAFKNGDRRGEILYKQFQGSELKTVGEYYSINNTLDLLKGHSIQWKGSVAPRDRIIQLKSVQQINLTIYVLMCILASFGIVLACLFIAVNIKFRSHRYIKMSSPNINNVIVVGCILTYSSVFLFGADGRLISYKHFSIVCTVRTWVLAIGFTLSFGGMFTKTWRVHVIFTNLRMKGKNMKDQRLFLMLSTFLLIDVILLSIWQRLDPQQRRTKELPGQILSSAGDLEIIPVSEYCYSNHINIWLSSMYAYKGLLLIFGCFLAWETRDVSIPALNDSKYIGMSVYNVVITCVSSVSISFIIQDRQDAAYLVIALFIVFCTTLTLCLVFVPKILRIKTDPTGLEKRHRATLCERNKMTRQSSKQINLRIKQLVESNIYLRKLFEKKKREEIRLTQRLVDDPETNSHNDITVLE